MDTGTENWLTDDPLTLSSDLSWAKTADNVLLIGPGGTGKTHIAAALGHLLIGQGVYTKLFPALALVQQLQQID